MNKNTRRRKASQRGWHQPPVRRKQKVACLTDAEHAQRRGQQAGERLRGGY